MFLTIFFNAHIYKYLQNKTIDLVKVVNHINLTKNQLTFIRENVTSEFNKIFVELIRKLNDLELRIEILRLAKCQKIEQIYKQKIAKNTLK